MEKLETGKQIIFKNEKALKYIKPLGAGGTGRTYLFEDETTDMYFAIKKYDPKDKRYVDEFFDRFVDEIKILFNLSHPNIVRIFNYFLYPKHKVGYLQMEYIEGVTLEEFAKSKNNSKSWNDIFIEVISAFKYLEHNKILHRDIRPQNIMIDSDGKVKIIDFGFGKQYECTSSINNSICLNWPVSEFPKEILQEVPEYNHSTEVYFVGKLFTHFEGLLFDFRFRDILLKMVDIDPNNRFQSFVEIDELIANGEFVTIGFSEKEKDIYIDFADALVNCISCFSELPNIKDKNSILTNLKELYRNTYLEYNLPDCSQLISCFVSSRYYYRTRINIEMVVIRNFVDLLFSSSKEKQDILFDNIINRLNGIKVDIYKDSDIPF